MILAVDASALVAIAFREPEGLLFQAALSKAESAFMAPANVLEAGLAIVVRQALLDIGGYVDWLSELGVVEWPVAGASALEAYLRFGKGIHRASLNFGDCFAYALAKQLDAPLLYKGKDFDFTDVRPALQPM